MEWRSSPASTHPFWDFSILISSILLHSTELPRLSKIIVEDIKHNWRALNFLNRASSVSALGCDVPHGFYFGFIIFVFFISMYVGGHLVFS